jgi:integrase
LPDASLSSFAKRRPRGVGGIFLTTGKLSDWLLEFESVRSWIDGYTAPMTRRNYLNGLNTICRKLNLNPDQLLELGRGNGDKVPRELKLQIKDVLNDYVQNGKLGEAKKINAAIRSFLEAHELAINFTHQERIRYRRKKVADEKIPSIQEVYSMADAADKVKGWRNPLKKLRAKALILCAFQSGVRPSCLIKWNYGLVKESLFPTLKAPVPLRITAKLDSKLLGYDLPYYYTFLGQEAASALKEYLEARMNRGAKFDDDSPVFATYGNNSQDTQVSYGDYFSVVKRVAKTAGISPNHLWPHLLRKSFKKVLNRSSVDDDTREALMGHRIPGSRENYFDRHDLGEVANRYGQCNFTKEEPREQRKGLLEEAKERPELVEEFFRNPRVRELLQRALRESSD